MRIAIYSDIHGNTPGLEAVHQSINNFGAVDEEICLGDLLYGGPGCGEILKILQQRGVRTLRGNHDEDLAIFDSIRGTLPKNQQRKALEWNRWMLGRLSAENLRYLSSMPMTHSITVRGFGRILLAHAHPSDITLRTLGPDVPESTRVEAFSTLDCDLLIAGHWHEPARLSYPELEVLCPGSIGMRHDGIAHWLFLDVGENGLQVDFRDVAYDQELFELLALEAGMPKPPEHQAPGPLPSAELPSRRAPR